MLIIWSGWGILAALIGVGCFVIMVSIQRVFAVKDPHVPIIVTALIAAAACWYVGRWLNHPARARILIDKATNREAGWLQRHTLFWIPLQYWALAYIAVALAEVAAPRTP